VSLLGIVAALITFGTTAPTLALMIGLGVGIDYALFLTTRYRQQIADGADPVPAAGWTVATSGQAVLVAAGTVALALLGLYASGITFIGRLGLAAVFSVLTAAAAALTLVPALLGALGRRIDSVTVRAPVAESGSDGDSWHRYARTVARRPWLFLVSALVILGVLTIPLFSIHLGHIDDGADPSSFTDGRAYNLIAAGFGVGANGPMTVVVDTQGASRTPSELASSVSGALASTPGIARLSPPEPSEDGGVLVSTVIPATSPQDTATSELFERLVKTTLPDAVSGTGAKTYVTGNLATQLEFRDTLTARLPLVIGVVVALAFLLLMATFRSVLIALKAAVLNLLSIGAAYGVIVAVFQWGWGGSLAGVGENVPIESYVPVLMFAIVFGLSMDYEVFLLSRVKEAWERTGDNTEAVADGLSRTARVITCAALIMASVFISFVLSSSVVVKMLAVGLAVSVIVDATVVRLILVPATMTLFGRANWWLPGWLDRLLPRIAAEGAAGPAPAPAATGEPSHLAPPA
jgi:RND superfamily putative drug exporter